MKKLILIIISVFFITGCFNYIEINNLVIVSGIGIDYKDNKYEVYFEVLSQNKEKSDSNFESGIIKKGTGDTIPEAFDDITSALEKEPYFAHLKVVVIGKEVANNNLSELFDFFLRNNDIRNIFSLVIANNSSPLEVLSKTNEYYPVASERIKNLLNNNIYSNYIAKNKYFKNIASNYLSNEINIALSTIDIDNEELKLGNIAIFNDQKLVDYLTNDEALILSVIDNNKPSSIFKYSCEENKYVVIRTYKSKTKIDINENRFTINNNVDAEVIENSCNINLENNKNQKELEKIFEKILTTNAEKLIYHLKIKNSDILGINNMYYIKKRKKNNKYFKTRSFEIKTNININKKGLIFEVKNDK